MNTLAQRIEPFIETLYADSADEQLTEVVGLCFDALTPIGQIDCLKKIIPEDLREEVIAQLEDMG